MAAYSWMAAQMDGLTPRLRKMATRPIISLRAMMSRLLWKSPQTSNGGSRGQTGQGYRAISASPDLALSKARPSLKITAMITAGISL